jgi:hypothetical protein
VGWSEDLPQQKGICRHPDDADTQSASTSTLDLPTPHPAQDEPDHDPIRALTTPSENAAEGDNFDIFQFFADGPSTRESLASTASDETPAKPVVTIVESSIKTSTSPRMMRRNVTRVGETAGEGGQTERWFSKVESML